ncbi:MAG TPA: TonB family protein [Prolixibacteraceae bacterium]|nr:TonB family protein [Prolixibacteraceae bacterium]
MKPFVNYIIETGLSLGVFTLAYWFILRSENRFRANRFYLLGALLFSTLLPFLTIHINLNDIFNFTKNTFRNGGVNMLETVTVYASGFPSRVGSAILSFNYSVLIYRLGAIAALFFIAAGLFQLAIMVSKNRVFKLKRAKLVVSQREISPYSFFNFIFIGKDLTTQENWKSMVQHEMVHVKQGHSFDVLFIDFMMIFQWFNPFYWIIRRMVRENHEFLADSGVLSKGTITPGRYKALLLSQAIGGIPVITSNFFNVKSIQKRFKMMSKNKKGKLGFLKYSLSIFAAVVIVLLFACENKDAPDSSANNNVSGQIQTDSDGNNILGTDKKPVYTTVDVTASFQDGDLNSFRNWVMSNLQYPEVAAENGIQGKVYVEFTVNAKGEVENVNVLKSVDPSLDKEAIRVIESSPKWTPAKYKKKKVNQAFVIPLSFVLQ